MPEKTFLPVRDSKMQGAPEFAKVINYGGAPNLRHIVLYAGGNKSAWERTIVDFDVVEIDGAKILGASLVRDISLLSNGGHQAKLSRCTRPGEWIEGEVTWLRYKTGSDWTNEGGDFDDTGPPPALTYSEPTTTGVHELVGLVSFVEDALDSRGGIVSLITRLDDEDPNEDTGATWYSRERPQSWRLVVEYAPPDPGRRSVPRSARRRSATPRTSSRPARPQASARPQQPIRRRK